jgi:hypothetical protein
VDATENVDAVRNRVEQSGLGLLYPFIGVIGKKKYNNKIKNNLSLCTSISYMYFAQTRN